MCNKYKISEYFDLNFTGKTLNKLNSENLEKMLYTELFMKCIEAEEKIYP